MNLWTNLPEVYRKAPSLHRPMLSHRIRFSIVRFLSDEVGNSYNFLKLKKVGRDSANEVGDASEEELNSLTVAPTNWLRFRESMELLMNTG